MSGVKIAHQNFKWAPLFSHFLTFYFKCVRTCICQAGKSPPIHPCPDVFHLMRQDMYSGKFAVENFSCSLLRTPNLSILSFTSALHYLQIDRTLSYSLISDRQSTLHFSGHRHCNSLGPYHNHRPHHHYHHHCPHFSASTSTSYCSSCSAWSWSLGRAGYHLKCKEAFVQSPGIRQSAGSQQARRWFCFICIEMGNVQSVL